jgi:DNA-binding transcriptional regulator PaaX
VVVALDSDTPWLVVCVKVPTTPTRHRVAVWRELRRLGAVVIGQGVWALPNVPALVEGLGRAASLAAEGDGDLMILESRGQTTAQAEKMSSLFAAARADEWAEFLADCQKFLAEIDREIAIDKLTMAELEEEEQSLDRLRRWHHDLKQRDLFDTPAGTAALSRLRECNDRLEEYADLVYARAQQA